MKLTDRKWKEFYVQQIFEVSGTVTTLPTQLIKGGNTPRITCAATNNALDDFYQNKPTEKGGVITVDSATIGYTSYQGHDFIATDHVEKLSFKNSKAINCYIGLFLKQAIDSSVLGKYNYGYKFSQNRIKKQKVLLPTKDGQPDYQFMEDYIKEMMTSKRQAYVQFLKKQAERDNKQINIQPLDSKKWKAFAIVDIFPSIQRGKRLIKENQQQGCIPYVSSSALNNGVDNFITYDGKRMRKFNNCLSLANSGSVGATFYEPFDFVASDHITHLKNKSFQKTTYLFLATLGNRLSQKYNFNREINDLRISREKILLPVDDAGNPDYAYMEAFTHNIIAQKRNEYISYVKSL